MKKLLNLLRFIYDKLDDDKTKGEHVYILCALCSIPTVLPFIVILSILLIPYPYVIFFGTSAALLSPIIFMVLFSLVNSIHTLWNEYNRKSWDDKE